MRRLGWLVFIGFVLLIILVFYAGFYRYLLASDSSAESIENNLHVAAGHREAGLLVLGDSTAVEDFRTNDFNRYTRGLKAANAAVPGTWFYSDDKIAEILKQKNPRLKTVLLFAGPDQFSEPASIRLPTELQYNKTRLSPADFPRLARYSDTAEDFYNQAVNLFFAPVLYKSDLADIIMHPLKRSQGLRSHFFWLIRPVSPQDPFWEDTRDSDACDFPPYGSLDQEISRADKDHNAPEAGRLRLIKDSLLPRLRPKKVSPLTGKNLERLAGQLSGNFSRVYLVNAPENPNNGIYPEEYLRDISRLTEKAGSGFANVRYIPRSRKIENDCRNFLDVVHLNPRGSKAFTAYLWSYISRDNKNR